MNDEEIRQAHRDERLETEYHRLHNFLRTRIKQVFGISDKELDERIPESGKL